MTLVLVIIRRYLSKFLRDLSISSKFIGLANIWSLISPNTVTNSSTAVDNSTPCVLANKFISKKSFSISWIVLIISPCWTALGCSFVLAIFDNIRKTGLILFTQDIIGSFVVVLRETKSSLKVRIATTRINIVKEEPKKVDQDPTQSRTNFETGFPLVAWTKKEAARIRPNTIKRIQKRFFNPISSPLESNPIISHRVPTTGSRA